MQARKIEAQATADAEARRQAQPALGIPHTQHSPLSPPSFKDMLPSPGGDAPSTLRALPPIGQRFGNPSAQMPPNLAGEWHIIGTFEAPGDTVETIWLELEPGSDNRYRGHGVESTGERFERATPTELPLLRHLLGRDGLSRAAVLTAEPS